MRARNLVGNATLDPDQLKIAYKAFDEAWEVVRSQYGTDPTSTEVGRLRLANAVLAAFRDGLSDAGAIKTAALEAMKRRP